MKPFNLKIAAIIFMGVAAIDATLWIFEHYLPESPLVFIPWWVVNFPSFPLGQMIKNSVSYGWFWICAGLFSALMWSWVAGLYFRHDDAA